MTAAPVSNRRIWLDLLLYPTHSLPTALAPVLIGAAIAYRDGYWAPLPVAVAFLASWLIHAAGVFFDNERLLVLHPDNREHPELVEALRSGQLTVTMLRAAIIAWLLAALAALPYLWSVAGPLAAVIGVIGVIASLSYAGGPLAYARAGLADPMFLVMFGVAAEAAIYFVAAHGAGHPISLGEIPFAAFAGGLPAGALIVCVLVIDDLRDGAEDAAKGWRTTTVRFGRFGAGTEFTALAGIAYVLPIVFWASGMFGPWVLLSVATLPFVLAMLRAVWLADLIALAPATPRMAFIALAYSALLAVGIALSR